MDQNPPETSKKTKGQIQTSTAEKEAEEMIDTEFICRDFGHDWKRLEREVVDPDSAFLIVGYCRRETCKKRLIVPRRKK